MGSFKSRVGVARYSSVGEMETAEAGREKAGRWAEAEAAAGGMPSRTEGLRLAGLMMNSKAREDGQVPRSAQRYIKKRARAYASAAAALSVLLQVPLRVFALIAMRLPSCFALVLAC